MQECTERHGAGGGPRILYLTECFIEIPPPTTSITEPGPPS